ncbi:hypothetical protein S40285_04368 [Stachybotrys chlorohalonatus IBT 40285]|uniref:Nudix hydrolase domain-containing protein n=1 Tax=Stachybotrys chlorohalonatus (strain IBT 40285) TaxID=1283841 RepID=A0A084QG56_STAC4|nr:hypothetical protein S40285_04368 [Stachybotrys chlorohalonata IBT 40285]
MPDDDKLQHRSVAASFLLRFPNDDTSQRPKVALFRRSDKVRTYQCVDPLFLALPFLRMPNQSCTKACCSHAPRHKYAPISGSVDPSDPSPFHTAVREIREETSLAPPLIRLFRTGKPYSFRDDAVGRVWHIHPFAFVLSVRATEAAHIKLDWEHDGYAWFDVEDVGAVGDGVPRLGESLRRVWFDLDLGEEAGGALARGLLALQRDHESGARQLAGKAVDIFVDVVARLNPSSRDAWWRNARLAAWHLWKNGREAMGASILSVLLTSLSLIEARLPPASTAPLPTAFTDDAVAAINGFSERHGKSSERIASSFAAFLAETFPEKKHVTILTLSHSSTISSCIAHALRDPAAPSLGMRVLESRPLFEGVALARSLADTIATTPCPSSTATIYTDACAAIASRSIDMLLLGADLIDRAGRVSNKAGSLPAVLCARHVAPAAKVVALAEKSKVLPFDPPHQELEENDPGELVRAWGEARPSPGRVKVRNAYFEWVPQGLVDSYVTEDGVLTTGGIEAWATEERKRADGFFSDL